jgi:lipoate-protein ligase A
MMKKKFVLSEQAISVLNSPKGKNKLMDFFDIKDRRTVENYLSNNVPQSILMNIHIADLIRELAPYMTNKMIFRRLTDEEIMKMNSDMIEPLIKNGKDDTNTDIH